MFPRYHQIIVQPVLDLDEFHVFDCRWVSGLELGVRGYNHRDSFIRLEVMSDRKIHPVEATAESCFLPLKKTTIEALCKHLRWSVGHCSTFFALVHQMVRYGLKYDEPNAMGTGDDSKPTDKRVWDILALRAFKHDTCTLVFTESPAMKLLEQRD